MKSLTGKRQLLVAPVYDIKNCGPWNRFSANGLLVHNSGGDKMNLQNLPRGGEIRKSLIAPPGHMIVAADSSNIEGRVNGWFCGQHDLIKHFAEGNDVYCELASKIYGRKITKADKKERMVGKVSVLGLGYGTGWKKLQQALKNGGADMSDAECQRIVEIYRSTNYAIRDMWRTCGDVLSNMVAGYSGEFGVGIKLKYEPGKIYLPNWMYLLYPELRYRAEATATEERGYSYRRKHFRARIYNSKLLENIIQALARIVVFDQMGRIAQKLKEKGGNSNGKIRQVVLTVHDEVVVVVPEEEAEETKAMMEEMMRVRPAWAPDLPVDCEGGIGKSYGEAK